MNNIFSFHRFGKLLKNDIVRYVSKYYGGIIIFLAIMPVLFWGLSTVLGFGHISTGSRWSGIFATTLLCTFIAPFVIYGSANNRKKGVDFTMLPASGLEKFLSMILLCSIALPVLFYAVSILIDTLLACIPYGAYRSMLSPEKILSGKHLSNMGQLILFQCFALAGNMVFRKNKISKTLLSLFSFGIILGVVISSVMYRIVLREVKTLEENGIENMINAESQTQDDNAVHINADVAEAGSIGRNRETETIANDTVITTMGVINGNTPDEGIRAKAENGGNHASVSVNSDKKHAFTVRRNGKTYTMNENLFQFLEEHSRGLEIFLKIIFIGVIPLLMYLLTYFRIKKQQL